MAGKPEPRRDDYRYPREKNRRGGTERIGITLTLGQLCAAVAYHYHLTPHQIAQFSGPQLLLWYERAAMERGYDKLIDLQVQLVPHSEDPQRSLQEVNQFLLKMTGNTQHG